MIGKIREVREYLKKYADVFFMLFFLPLAGCVAMGISSGEMIYKVVFVFAMLFYMMKIFVTDYSVRQWLVMTGIMSLLGYVFLRTREKALILTTLAIFGCKDVPVRKVLKYTVFVYAIGMVVTIGLVRVGIIEGEIHTLYKNGIKYEINDMGFSQPNSAYGHLLMLALMIVIVWKEKIRWYHYVALSAIMWIGYKVFMCRTGIYIYMLLCLVLLVDYLVRSDKIKTVLLFAWSLLPIVSGVTGFILALLYEQCIPWVNIIDHKVSGRIKLSYDALSITEFTWLGTTEMSWKGDFFLDNAYLNIFLSYGFLVMILFVLSYYFTSFFLWKKKMNYELIVIGIVAIYAVMEYTPVNITWTPVLLYISVLLANESNKPEKRKNQS